MHLNIKNDEAHRLASELSRLTGESLTTTVTQALRERLERQRRAHAAEAVAARLMEIGRAYAELPPGPFSTPDEAVGYDEQGLPT